MDLRSIVSMVLIIFLRFNGVAGGALQYNFYEESCPQLEDIVSTGLHPIFLTDPTSAPALLRLLFHDCQVQGCDASILVDTVKANRLSEMTSAKNFGIRKRDLIGNLKTLVEDECPGQVSCADILVLAAREAVASSWGPLIKVPLGRRDSSAAPSYQLADSLIPPATTGVDEMLRIFTSKGMTVEESVAIMGSHTLGITHCLNINLNRLYKPEGVEAQGILMDPAFEAFLRLTCPKGSLISNITFVLNDVTPTLFDNHYYMNAMGGRGVLTIDAEMVIDPRTAQIVEHFATNQDDFFHAFSTAFLKLSSSGVLTGDQGVIRRKCNVID